jgi:phospholipase/lecithinase/hemolysin
VDSNTSEQCGTTLSRSRFGWFVALVCLVCPSNAFAGFSSLYIFGDSLSDSGNNAVVLAPNVNPGSHLREQLHPDLSLCFGEVY